MKRHVKNECVERMRNGRVEKDCVKRLRKGRDAKLEKESDAKLKKESAEWVGQLMQQR